MGHAGMTQNEMILQYMKDVPSGITPLDALREFGCMRLGARIYDLQREGHEIEHLREESKNRYGRKVSYSRYRLMPKRAEGWLF